ncbi:hypothetical protein A0H81_12969 [Grifola frondosa]|uniref:Uncharacterized protein n=1 Tax=Grifola frondosa TaxID=5627 RepID=A0A1C7LSS8_GRIFR|nr:hypothetical protein A0H81_12969 [Grifola frondosa]
MVSKLVKAFLRREAEQCTYHENRNFSVSDADQLGQQFIGYPPADNQFTRGHFHFLKTLFRNAHSQVEDQGSFEEFSAKSGYQKTIPLQCMLAEELGNQSVWPDSTDRHFEPATKFPVDRTNAATTLYFQGEGKRFHSQRAVDMVVPILLSDDKL